MGKINELNSCRQNGKAGSMLVDTQIKGEVEYYLNNGKKIKNMVKSKVLLETISGKERLIENLNINIQSLVVTDADKLNELTESYNIVSSIYRCKKYGWSNKSRK